MNRAAGLLLSLLLVPACRPAEEPPVPAEAPEAFLPEPAAAVVHIPDLDALRRGIPTARWATLPGVSGSVPAWLEALGGIAWRGPLAVAVYPERSGYSLVACARGAGATTAGFEAALDGLGAATEVTVGGVPARARRGLLSATVGDAWLCATGDRLAAAVALAQGQAPERSVRLSASFRAAQAAAPTVPGLVTAVVDLAYQVDYLLEGTPHGVWGQAVMRQLDALQLRTLRALSLSVSAEDQRLRVAATLGLTRDRVGLAGLVEVASGPFLLQGLLPERVRAHAILMLRANLLPVMESIEAGGATGGLLGDGPNPMQVAQSLLGVSLRDDVVKQLTGEFAVFGVGDPPTAGSRRSVRDLVSNQVLVVGMKPGHGLDDKLSQLLRTRQFGTRRVLQGGEVWQIPATEPRFTVALTDEFLAAAVGDHAAELAALVEHAARPEAEHPAWSWPAELATLTARAAQLSPAQCSGLMWSSGSGVRGFCRPTAAGLQVVVEF